MVSIWSVYFQFKISFLILLFINNSLLGFMHVHVYVFNVKRLDTELTIVCNVNKACVMFLIYIYYNFIERVSNLKLIKNTVKQFLVFVILFKIWYFYPAIYIKQQHGMIFVYIPKCCVLCISLKTWLLKFSPGYVFSRVRFLLIPFCTPYWAAERVKRH